MNKLPEKITAIEISNTKGEFMLKQAVEYNRTNSQILVPSSFITVRDFDMVAPKKEENDNQRS